MSTDTDVSPVIDVNDPMAEAERLRREMAEAKALFEELRNELMIEASRAREQTARADQAELELKQFKQEVVEVGGRYAADHDWCATYDQIMSELGLPRREQQFEVNIRCHFSQTVYVIAHDEDEAIDKVNELVPAQNRLSGSFLAGTVDAGRPYDLAFEVRD